MHNILWSKGKVSPCPGIKCAITDEWLVILSSNMAVIYLPWSTNCRVKSSRSSSRQSHKLYHWTTLILCNTTISLRSRTFRCYGQEFQVAWRTICCVDHQVIHICVHFAFYFFACRTRLWYHEAVEQ